MESETGWKLLRAHHLQFGGADLPNFVAATCPPDWLDYFIRRVGIPTAGLIGAEALKQFRIGIDYAHGTVYLQEDEKSAGGSFDLIGLTLRPEVNGDFSVLGTAEFHGKAAVDGARKGDILIKVNNHPVNGLTMGQVWSLLSGSPGAVYHLELKRNDKIVLIKARIYHFLD